jgi:hypothetical protein
MPAGPSNQAVLVDDPTSPALTIESWPLRDEPIASTLLLGTSLVVGLAVGLVGQNWLIGLASALALVLALRGLWLPAEYQLNELGVRRTVLGRSRRTPWREIGGYQIGSTALALWPDRQFTLRSMLRGMTIPYGDRRDQLVAIVEHYMTHADD